jgi:cell division septum initiation protein DivIVA
LVIQGQIKLKENALEASSKIFIEKEKDLKNRIEELQTKLNEVSQNSQETDETLQGPEAIAMQYTEVLPLSKRYVQELV